MRESIIKKWNMRLWLLLAVMLAFSPVRAQAAWQKTAAGMMYTANNSKGYLTGWQTIDGARYYFSGKGIMETGWAVVSKNAYYFGSDGRMRTGWQTIGKYTYYFGNDGVKRKGWTNVASGNSTYRYYFEPANGRMKTGFATISGKRYYFQSNGRLQYGFIRLSGKVYYADAKTGELYRSQWLNNTYYFQADYTMAVNSWVSGRYIGADGRATSGGNSGGSGSSNKSGFVTTGGQTVYYGSNGKKVTGWQKINGKYYYFNGSGYLQKNSWIKSGGKWYHVGSDGARQYGLIKIGNNYYFLSVKKDGRRLSGWITSGKKRYRSDANGVVYHSKFFTVGGKKYFAKSNCDLASGLTVISGKTYYFETAKRVMQKNVMKKVNGATWYFGSNGAAITGKWQKVNGKYYYFGKDGKMLKNTTVDGYKVGADGARVSKASTSSGKTGWKTVNGKKAYYVNGQPATGWKTVGKKKYYFDSNGYPLKHTQTINGKKYYFLATGQLASGFGTLSTADDVGGVLMLYTVDNNGVITSEKKVSGSGKGYKVALAAVKYIGSKYVYGGTSLTNGLDCSSFAQQMMKKGAGVSITRSTYTQVDEYRGGHGKKIAVKASSLKPGDLIYYNANAGYSHVAIYIGKGMICHASNSAAYPAGGVKVSNYLNGSGSNAGMLAIRFW